MHKVLTVLQVALAPLVKNLSRLETICSRTWMVPHDVERMFGGQPLVDGRNFAVRGQAVEIS